MSSAHYMIGAVLGINCLECSPSKATKKWVCVSQEVGCVSYPSQNSLGRKIRQQANIPKKFPANFHLRCRTSQPASQCLRNGFFENRLHWALLPQHLCLPYLETIVDEKRKQIIIPHTISTKELNLFVCACLRVTLMYCKIKGHCLTTLKKLSTTPVIIIPGLDEN